MKLKRSAGAAKSAGPLEPMDLYLAEPPEAPVSVDVRPPVVEMEPAEIAPGRDQKREGERLLNRKLLMSYCQRSTLASCDGSWLWYSDYQRDPKEESSGRSCVVTRRPARPVEC